MRTYEIGLATRAEVQTAVMSATLPVPEIPRWLQSTYMAIAKALASQHIDISGPPFARYRQLAADRFQVEAGFPVNQPVGRVGEVVPSTLPGGELAVTVHVGPYDQLTSAYQAVADWMDKTGHQVSGPPWEVYYSDPEEQPDPDTWRTEVIQPLASRSSAR